MEQGVPTERPFPQEAMTCLLYALKKKGNTMISRTSSQLALSFNLRFCRSPFSEVELNLNQRLQPCLLRQHLFIMSLTHSLTLQRNGVQAHIFSSLEVGGVAPHQFVPFCAKRATGRSPPTSKWCTIFRAYPPSHFLKFSNIQQWYQSAKRSLCETKNYFILYTCLSLLFPFIILVLSVEVPLFTYLDTQVYICATFNSIFVPCLFWVNEHQPFHVCFVPL